MKSRSKLGSGAMLLLALPFLSLLAGCESTSLKREFSRRCAEDGGMRVYEVVKLSPSALKEVLRYKTELKNTEEHLGPQYRYVIQTELLGGREDLSTHKGASLRRVQASVFRKSDGKLLGESVHYIFGRNVGMGAGAKACPHQGSVAEKIFVKE